jgi:hypothetical protein
MAQHQEDGKYLEVDRRHGEEVDRNQLLGVILQECASGLRWGFQEFCCRSLKHSDLVAPRQVLELEGGT